MGVRRRPRLRGFNRVPKDARRRLFELIRARVRTPYAPNALPPFPIVYRELFLALGRPVVTLADVDYTGEATRFAEIEVGDLIMLCKWYEFYDICEKLVQLCADSSRSRLDSEIDSVFEDEGLPYSMGDGLVVWRGGTPLFREAVIGALGLLGTDARFAGPARQLGKASQHLNRRPPDAENCVKDAVGALEGVAGILFNEPKATLGELMKRHAGRLNVHPALGGAILLSGAVSKVYGYSSDEDAIRHGAAGALKEPLEEAELVLHWCAASIVYLIRKSDALSRQSSSAVPPSPSP
jgi:hypothetical protein